MTIFKMIMYNKSQLNIDISNVFIVNNQEIIKFKKMYNICHYA